MISDLYNKVLKLRNADIIASLFLKTLIDTNRTHQFFVDWTKVEENVSRFKIEFSILDTLINSKNFDCDLINILKKYPETILPAVAD